jgi:hypothetical protein
MMIPILALLAVSPLVALAISVTARLRLLLMLLLRLTVVIKAVRKMTLRLRL